MARPRTADWGAHGTWKAGSHASNAREPTTFGGAVSTGVAAGEADGAEVDIAEGAGVGAIVGAGGGGSLVHATTTTASSAAAARLRDLVRLLPLTRVIWTGTGLLLSGS